MRLHKSCYLGFRRGPETWIARFSTRGSKGRYSHQYKSLDAYNFDTAKDLAESWFANLGSPAARVIKRGSVRDALETYIAYLREQGREATADNAKDRFKLIVWETPFALLPLEDLTRQDFREWRSSIRSGRQNRSVNRHVRSVVAGLNRAIREGHSGNAEAWLVDPLTDDAEGSGDSTVFLTPSQRDAIVKAACREAGDFLRAVAFTGARPGELAAANVADLDTKTATLILKHKKGRPAKLRPRAVVLSNDALKFFTRIALSKLPTAPLLSDPDGERWGRHRWSDKVKLAIKAVNAKAKGQARIPFGSCAYSFRHARISELLQDYGVDPITVAQQTGTSTRMIEQNYYKFIAPALREKLSALEGTR